MANNNVNVGHTTSYSTNKPMHAVVGDLFVDASVGTNYVYDGSRWVLISDPNNEYYKTNLLISAIKSLNDLEMLSDEEFKMLDDILVSKDGHNKAELVKGMLTGILRDTL